MKTGLVIGKFYPFHKGHEYLIETARAQVEQLTVLVCEHVEQRIPGDVRARWIRHAFPEVLVRVIPDTVAPDDSKGWAKHTLCFLGYVPDVVFTSESYGDPYAQALGSVHMLVDRKRASVPISATMIRSDMWQYAQFLRDEVRQYFLRHVVVVGAESTGTTTLARDLARAYKTHWVPEVGRYYSEGKVFGPSGATWREEELTWIAQAHVALEDALARDAQKVLVHDTNPFATELWHERLVGGVNIVARTYTEERQYDLYLVTDVSIPFVQDGTREGGEGRIAMHNRFIEELSLRGMRYAVVSGTRTERLAFAVSAIETMLKDTCL